MLGQFRPRPNGSVEAVCMLASPSSLAFDLFARARCIRALKTQGQSGEVRPRLLQIHFIKSYLSRNRSLEERTHRLVRKFTLDLRTSILPGKSLHPWRCRSFARQCGQVRCMRACMHAFGQNAHVPFEFCGRREPRLSSAHVCQSHTMLSSSSRAISALNLLCVADQTG